MSLSACVVYQAIADTNQRHNPPSPLPSGQTAASGKIVPVAVGTNAVKVQLPTVMTAGQSYAIWMVNPSGVSFDIKIVDISANIVNGVDQTHSSNLIGWGAGIFLNHATSQENILVAGNRFSCIGSRSGVDAAHKSDGEAISTDAPGNILSFRSGQWVTDADRNTVTVAADRHDMRLSLRHEEYTGRWIQVDFGSGLG